MPQALPIVGQIALNLAIGVGASLLSSAVSALFAPEEAAAQGWSLEMAVGEGVPISAVCGYAAAKGALHYINEYGYGDDYRLQLVVRVGIGPHHSLDKVLVGGKISGLSGSNADPLGRVVEALRFNADGDVDPGGTPHAWVKYYTGAAGQAADPELIARAEPAGRWTADHKMTGWAYEIWTLRPHAKGMSSMPRLGRVWKGRLCYDWRKDTTAGGAGAHRWHDPSTWEFSANPVVIRYNYRRGLYLGGVRVWGGGYPDFAQDRAAYTGAANICDELVDYPETSAQLPRYAYGREISDAEPRLSVMGELDDAIAGSSFRRGGADVPLPAQQLVPVMVLEDSDRLLGHPVLADRKGRVSLKRSMIHGQFVDSTKDFAVGPYAPRINDDISLIIGDRRATPRNQPYEWLSERAQGRAEIWLREQLYPASRVETFAPIALALEPGDLIVRRCEWGAMHMRVKQKAPVRDAETGAVLGATLTLTQWDNTIVPASGESFVTIPAPTGPAGTPAPQLVQIAGFGIGAYQDVTGDDETPRAQASWTPITDPRVDQVLVRYWPDDGSEAGDATDVLLPSRPAAKGLLPALRPETDYSGKAMPIRSDGRPCLWTAPVSFTTGPLIVDGQRLVIESVDTPQITPEAVTVGQAVDVGSGYQYSTNTTKFQVEEAVLTITTTIPAGYWLDIAFAGRAGATQANSSAFGNVRLRIKDGSTVLGELIGRYDEDGFQYEDVHAAFVAKVDGDAASHTITATLTYMGNGPLNVNQNGLYLGMKPGATLRTALFKR